MIKPSMKVKPNSTGIPIIKSTPTVDVFFRRPGHPLRRQPAHKLGKPLPPAHGGESAHHVGRIHDMKGLVEHCMDIRWGNQRSAHEARQNAECFMNWIGPKVAPREALTMANVHAYVKYRISEKRNVGKTVNRHLSNVSVLCETARDLKLIPEKLELPWQKEGKGRVRFYTQDEERMLLATCRLWSMEDYHDLFIFLADTGARLGETQSLPWSDIRGKAITLVYTKTGAPLRCTLRRASWPP